MIACDKGHTDVARYLVEKKANVNIKNKVDVSSQSCIYSTVVHLYIHYHTDHHDCHVCFFGNQKKWTALMIASSKGYTDVVRCLMDRKAAVNFQANVSISSRTSASLRTIAIKILNALTIKYFCSSQGGWTALMMASVNGHLDIVTLLVEKDAPVDTRNSVSSNKLHE